MDADLMDALRARGHEVSVLSPFRDPEAGRVGGSVAVGRLPRLLLSLPGYARVAARSLRLTRGGAHVVAQYHMYTPATLIAFLVARLRGLPLFAKAHHVFAGSYRSGIEARLNRWLQRVYRPILRHAATRVLVQSPEWRAHLTEAQGVSSDRVFVIPDNVTPHATPSPDLVGSLRRVHGLEGKRVVLKFGSFTRDSPAVLAEALRLLGREDAAAVVLADAEWGAAFRREAAAQGVRDLITLPLRPQEEVDAFVAMADVCVGLLTDHPMARGSTPRNTLEAMAAGKPSILARGVATATLTEDGRNCLLIPPGDAGALARALAGLLGTPRASALGEGARRTVDARFRSDIVAERMEQVLLSASGAPRP